MQLVVGMPNPFPKAVVEARRRQFYGRNLGLDIVREDVDGDPSKRCEVAILAHLYRMHLHASLARRLRSHGGRRRAFAGSPKIVKSSPWWAWGTEIICDVAHGGLGPRGCTSTSKPPCDPSIAKARPHLREALAWRAKPRRTSFSLKEGQCFASDGAWRFGQGECSGVVFHAEYDEGVSSHRNRGLQGTDVR